MQYRRLGKTGLRVPEVSIGLWAVGGDAWGPVEDRACIVYPGGMATNWGVWSPTERQNHEREPQLSTKALPPDKVAALIVWIASAPPELVLNEAIISPLEEQGWP